MPVKNNATVKNKRSKRGDSRKKPVYPSLGSARASAKKRAEMERRRRARPIEDYDKHLQEVGDFWPETESIDDFLAWLRESRRTGRY
jgi:hypothetical protein